MPIFAWPTTACTISRLSHLANSTGINRASGWGRSKNAFPRAPGPRPATLLQAKIEIAEKKYPQANEILQQLRAEKSAKREITEEALYLQATTRESKGEPRRAHALYDELRNLSPNSRWTAAARKAQ